MVKQALQHEYQLALQEIGPILPWWSQEDEMFVFEHPLYPMVVHADPNKDKTIAGYHRALKGFIEERMANNVAESVEKITSGRGGARPGAGRPQKAPTTRLSVPNDILDVVKWMAEDPKRAEKVRPLMEG